MAKTHWSEAYLHLSYVRGDLNCADLVNLVLKQECGRKIPLPSVSMWDKLSPQEVELFVYDFAIATDCPTEYDGVLMKIRGDTTESRWHVGVFSMVSGLPWILHALKIGGIVFTPVSKLRMLQLELVNYYKWLP